MSNSLRGTLIKSLFKVVTPLWLLVCLSLGILAWHEVNEMYDEQQSLFARQLYNTLPSLQVQNDRPPPLLGQGDHQAVAVWSAAGHRLLFDSDGVALAHRPGFSGFASIRHHNEAWRVYYLSGRAGSVAVAQEQAERWELIRGLLLTQAILWLLILPFALAALWWAVAHGLAPLTRICQQLQQREPEDASPLAGGVPVELQPLITAMNGLIARAAATLQRERRFTSDAAHELRSPLAAIRVQAEVAQLVDDEALRDKALMQLMCGVDRSSQLLAQLLLLSKVDAAPALEMKKLDWPAMLQELAESVAQTAARCHVTLQWPEKDQQLWPLQEGDHTLLLLMLRNLLDNAIRYGGGRVTLAMDGQEIRVTDEGAGLDDALLTKVRERFYRPPGQSESGSGLGLSIVERIASLHGLQLSLQNRQEGGLQARLARSD